MIRIGIDGWPFFGRPTGIGRYVWELCKCLDKLIPEARFFVYTPQAPSLALPAHWRLRIDPKPPRYMTGYLWLKTRCGHFCKDDDLQVFWANRTLTPRLSSSVRTVATVYDLNYLLVPETMPPVNLWVHRFWFKSDVHRADMVLTISLGTAERLKKHLGRQADGVVRPGLSDLFKPVSAGSLDQILRNCGICRPYLLAVGTQEPRKNLELLLRVYLSLRESGELPGFGLVLAGEKGWKTQTLRQLLERGKAWGVTQIGYVAEEALPALYSGAEVFVFPSLYEGFGIPVLEARACGARVVATDIPELREAGENEAIYVSPTIDGIRDGILLALARPKKKPEDLATRYSWWSSATVLAEALKSAATRSTGAS
jgi:glycosyltransferase involved in cell wall biosynthesis